MTSRPILFSAPMVRALLAGTKTQTRRVSGLDVINREPNRYRFLGFTTGPGNWHAAFRDEKSGAQVLVKVPYGQPGDRLWVRETFAHTHLGDGSGLYVFPVADPRTDYGGPWKPSIHMPRAASRIALEITGVRVERLQGISKADAIAEGVDPRCQHQPDESPECSAGLSYDPDGFAVDNYRTLWESINGPGSWDANPWVWVVEFKCLPTNHAGRGEE